MSFSVILVTIYVYILFKHLIVPFSFSEENCIDIQA